MRFTVRGMMFAVAIVAVLCSPSLVVVLALAVPFLAVWVLLATFAVIITDAFWDSRAAEPVSVVVVVAGGLYLAAFALSLRSPFDAAVLVLIPINLAGPFYAARRVYRSHLLATGEILWAWLGVLWSMLLANWHPHNADGVLLLISDGARLTLVMAVLLALYGTRPSRPGPVWAHHLGWAILECDVIVWAWYATMFLRWPWNR